MGFSFGKLNILSDHHPFPCRTIPVSSFFSNFFFPLLSCLLISFLQTAFPQNLLALIPIVRPSVCPLNFWFLDIYYLCPRERKHNQTKQNKTGNLTALKAVLASRDKESVNSEYFQGVNSFWVLKHFSKCFSNFFLTFYSELCLFCVSDFYFWKCIHI